MVRYANSKRRRLIGRFASIVAILVMIPASMTFWDALQESLFRRQATNFISETVGSYQFTGEGRYLEDFTDVEYNDGQNPIIEIVCMGNETIPESLIASWENKKNNDEDYKRLKNAELHIIQGAKSGQADQFKYVNELYESQKDQLTSKDEKIEFLESELVRINKLTFKNIPFKEISDEARVNYEGLISLEYDNAVKTDFSKIDTLSIFEVQWSKSIGRNRAVANNKKILDWLKIRLKDSTVQLRTVVGN